MPRFKSRVVEVQASQWFKNGDHPKDSVGVTENREGRIVRYFRDPEVSGKKICKHCQTFMFAHGWIDTLEGGHIVCPGDWIITGLKGEDYPCKPDIFKLKYELIVGGVAVAKPITVKRFIVFGVCWKDRRREATEEEQFDTVEAARQLVDKYNMTEACCRGRLRYFYVDMRPDISLEYGHN